MASEAHTRIGIARHQQSGAVCHQAIYEHHYSPKPVWLRGARPGCEMLRPAIRDGKVSFSFYGVNHPDTADHARCWLGNILRQEQEAGELGTVEFIVPEDNRNNFQRHYCWHVWLVSATDPQTRGLGIEIWLHISTPTGVLIQVLGGPDEEARNHVRGLLCQFCIVGDTIWNPIPDPPGAPQVQKVHRCREIQDESGKDFLLRSLSDFTGAEAQVLDCLAAVKASQAQGASEKLLEHLMDLQQAFVFATQTAKLRLRPEWQTATSAALDLLLEDPVLQPRAETLSTELLNYMSPTGQQAEA